MAQRPILITGAAGFIAWHVSASLLARGERVIGLDNLDPWYDPKFKRQNLHDLSTHNPGLFEFVHADIVDAAAVGACFAAHAPRAVVHLAAKAGVRPSIADPAGYAAANVVGTANILTASQRHGVERVVIASSSSVYGNSAEAPFREEMDVGGPISPYAATKRACELLAFTHHHLTKMPTACLRFFTVYGPRQRPDLAISRFLGRISRGETIEVFGDGTSSRDYTYASDIAAGVLAAMDRIDRFGYRVWNLGHSAPVALRDMIAAIARVVGRSANITHRPMQPGDVERTWADLTRSRAELGYEPRTEFEEGVRRQWEWMRTQHPE